MGVKFIYVLGDIIDLIECWLPKLPIHATLYCFTHLKVTFKSNVPKVVMIETCPKEVDYNL